MAKSAILAIRIVADASKASRGFDETGRKVGKFEQGMQKANKYALAAVTGIAAVGTVAFKSASRAQQAAGAVESVFGKQSGAVKKLAKDAATSVGLASSEYSELASVLGSQLGNLGISQDKIVGSTDDLIKKGADLAATFGGTTSEAVEALSALMRGERDPIERYGVSIKQNDINARLAAKGQDKLTGAAKKQAETQATLDLLNKQTAKSTGQFARELDSAAGSQQVAAAQFENAKAKLGRVLLPVVATGARLLGKFASVVEKNDKVVLALVGTIGAAASAVIAINAGMKAYRTTAMAIKTVTSAWAAAQKILNLTMLSNPVVLVVAAVVALVAAFIVAYKKSETFRKIVDGAMGAVGDAVGAVVDWVKNLAAWVGEKAPKAWDKLKRLVVRYLALVTTPHRALIRWIGNLVDWVRTKAPAAWATMRDKARDAVRVATAPVRVLLGVVKSVVTWARERVPAAFVKARDKGKAAFDKLVSPISTVVGWIKSLIEWIGSISWPEPPGWLKSIGSGLGNMFGRSSASPSAMTSGRGSPQLAPQTFTPSLMAATSSAPAATRRNATGGPVQIIVQGALDPNAVARQIEQLLRSRNLRLGRA